MCVNSLQSYLILCNSIDCSSPGYLSMRFSRQMYWSGLPCPPPGDPPDPGLNPDFFGFMFSQLWINMELIWFKTLEFLIIWHVLKYFFQLWIQSIYKYFLCEILCTHMEQDSYINLEINLHRVIFLGNKFFFFNVISLNNLVLLGRQHIMIIF